MDQKNQKYNILIAEDVPTDAEIAQREIKRENILFDALVVDKESDFKQALDEFKPDIIISDYSMPSFDGISALTITRNHHAYIPFIMLTGSINEETAVTCMKAGADDYVLKEKITRLPFAVKEVLRKKQEQNEKKQMEQQVKESMEAYRNLINSMNETVWIMDFDGKLLDINDRVTEVLGYTKEEVVGSDISDFDSQLTKLKIQTLFNTLNYGEAQVVQTKHRTKSGKEIPVEINSRLIQYQGEPAILSTARDITQRKKSENTKSFLHRISAKALQVTHIKEYLQFMHQELQEVMKANNFYIALYDGNTDSFTLPYHADEYDDFTTDKPVSLDGSLTKYILQNGKPELITTERNKELQEQGHIEVKGTKPAVWMGAPIIDSSRNEVVGVIVLQDYADANAYCEEDLDTLKVIAANIGLFIERVKSQEKLQLLNRAVEQNPVSIVITNADGVIEYTNPAFTRISGYSFEEVKGENPRILQSGDHSKEFYKNLWDTILAGDDWQGEFHDQKKNGDFYWEQAVISPIRNDKGEITHFVAVKEDITEKKKVFEELKAAKEKAEESDRLKSAFLTNISHEVRTPMNGILGFINLIDEPGLEDEERSEYIDIVNRSGQRLLDTINDIVELSRIDAGEYTFNPEKFDLTELMEYHLSVFEPEAQEKNLTLSLDQQVSYPESLIYSDRLKLESILSNLLKNAVKFTKQGKISFGNYLKDNDLVFYVEDTGKGIDPDKHDSIFERFVQADLNLTRAHEGSGLGLSIVKAFAELLDGKVWLHSETGKGSTFYVSVPYKQADEKSTAEANQSHSGSAAETEKLTKEVNILVAEDDPSSFMLLEALFSKEPVNLIHTETGEETVKQAEVNSNINLILMDIKLPGIDGLEATRQIRAFNASVPIIGQSAYAMKGDRDKAISAGCNDYITKPFRRKELMAMIQKYTS
ncbi:MAG: PAS domain S-box protein [Bacteroidota bacterium]